MRRTIGGQSHTRPIRRTACIRPSSEPVATSIPLSQLSLSFSQFRTRFSQARRSSKKNRFFVCFTRFYSTKNRPCTKAPHAQMTLGILKTRTQEPAKCLMREATTTLQSHNQCEKALPTTQKNVLVTTSPSFKRECLPSNLRNSKLRLLDCW